jgi:gliding motility-associated-like protein
VKRILIFYLTALTNVVLAQSLSTSLSACYALNGSASDPINNLTGTLSSVTNTVDRFNNSNSALAFSGSSLSYIELPNHQLLKPTNALSISMWVKTNSASEQIMAFTRNTATVNFGAYTLMMSNAGSNYVFRGYKETGNGNTNLVSSTTTVAVNTWYHVVYTVDNTSLKIYVNGTLEATTTSTLSFSYNSSESVYLGGTNESFNLPFNGSLDNVRFYTRVISATEVSQLYNNDPQCTSPGQALSFNGTNNFVDPNVQITSFNNSFTYEFWARPTATHEIDIESTTGIDGLYGQKFLLWPTWRGSTSVTQGGFGVSVGTNGVSVYAHGHNYFPPLLVWQGTINSWSHIAIVVNNKQPSLYINGAFVKTGLTASPTLWPSLGAAAMSTTLGPQGGGIGGGYSGFYYNFYQGEVDEFRLWNSIRTQAQIQAFMNKELVCPFGLYAYYKFNHGIAHAVNTVTTATDYSGNNYSASLYNFALNGSLSNWIDPGATLTGTATTLSVSATSTNVCTGQQILLSASGSSVYSWSTGAFTPTILVSPTVTTTYVVTGACSSTAAITLSVNQSPTVNISGPTASLCPGTPVTLNGSGASSYTWLPGGSGSGTITVNPQTTAIYTLSGSNGLCINAKTFTVNRYPSPLIFAISTPTIICSGSTATLNVGGGISYTWMPGNSNSPTYVVSPPVSTIYTVTASDGTCTGATTVNLVVTQSPTLVVSASESVTCPGYTSLLNATGATGYTWQPGSLTGSMVAVAPLVTTVYTVTGINSGGCGSGSTVLVTVNNCTVPPISCNLFYSEGVSSGQGLIIASDFSSPNSSTVLPSVLLPPGAQGLAVGPSFSFTSPNPTFWTTSGGTYWYHNGSTFVNTGHISNGVNIGASKNFIYSHIASGTVYKYNGTGNSSSVTTISAPTGYSFNDIVGDELDNFYVADQFNVIVYNSSGNNICTYTHSPISMTQVSIAGGLAISGNTFAFSNGSAGTIYLGQYQGAGVPVSSTSYSGGTLDFANCYMPLAFSSSIGASPGNTISCSTPVLTMSATPIQALSPSFSYTWAGPGITTPTNAASVQVNAPGSYSCFMRSCTGGTSIATFTVLSNPLNPVVSVSASTPSICSTSTATLTAGNSLTYTWQPGGVNSSALAVSPSVSTVYSVSGTNALGCTSTKTILISVNPTPTIIISGTGTTCAGSASTLTVTGASAYTWSPVPSTATSIAVTPTSTTVYTVTGSSNNCSDIKTFTVTVVPLPVITASSSSSTVCSTGSVVLTASGGSGYIWQGSVAGATLAVISPSATSSYSVTGFAAGCSNTAAVSVGVIASPTLSTFVSPSGIICQGTMYTITATGAGSYSWQPVISSSSSVVTMANAPGPVVYTITGSNSNCTSTVTRTVNISALPPLGASPASATVCSGNTVVLTASGATSYTWQPGNLQTAAITVTPFSNTTYTVFGSNGCVNMQTVTISTIATPTLSVGFSSSSICSGSSATLLASGASSYTWQPGIVTGYSIVVSPAVTTVYTLSGTSSGCSSSTFYTLTVNTTPTIVSQATPTFICKGQQAALTASGANGYTWQPGGMTGNSVLVSPATSQVYTVTGANSSSTCMSAATVQVNVDTQTALSVSATSNTLCYGNSAQLMASGALTYTWIPGNIVGPLLNITPGSSTIYSVMGTNNSGCVTTSTISITVIPPINLSVTASSSSICSNQTITLSVTGASTYNWLPVGLSGSVITVTPATTTIYSVTGSIGNCTASAAIPVYVDTLPAPVITGSNQFCAGAQATLTATGAESYTWTPGNTVGSTAVISPTSTTQYTVIAGNGGCITNTLYKVTVIATPTINIASTHSFICPGQSATLTANGASSYTWGSSQPGNQLVVSPILSTTYTASGTNMEGCSATGTIAIFVGSNLSLTVQPAGTICAGESVTVTASGGATYSWQPLNFTGNSIVLIPLATTAYTLTGYSGDCVSQITFTIGVTDCGNNFLGIANAASSPLLVNFNYYRVTFSVVATNSSPQILSDISLRTDLAKTFPSPVTFTVIEKPKTRTGNLKLTANPFFDGRSDVELLLNKSSLSSEQTDTLVYTVLVDPHGIEGPFKNQVTGSGTILKKVVTDSSANGMNPDPDYDGNPNNNHDFTPVLLPYISLFVPDGFSPNGDGLFDQFIVKGLGEQPSHLIVMNRWGNKVYEKENYDNSWDGTSNAGAFSLGKGKLPQGTYYYILQIGGTIQATRTGFIEIQY